MKQVNKTIKVLDIQGEEVILETDNGFKFPVPINFLIGLGDKSYYKETYRDFITKQMTKLNVYIPPEYW